MNRTVRYQPPVRMPADAGDGLTTARLSLRRYTQDDLPKLVQLNADAEVMQYLGGVMTEAQTREMIEGRVLPYYDEHPGLGAWITIERASGENIGFHLLNHIRGESLIQVGYRLERRHWGKGYATEMSLALLHYGYTVRGLNKLHAITDLGNAASQNVLLKSGLHRHGERRFEHPSYAASGPLAFFEREAADWLAECLPGSDS